MRLNNDCDLQVCVSADYGLSVLFLSYENPSHRVCVNDQCSVTRCCDGFINAYPANHSCVDPGEPDLPCDSYFIFRFCSVGSCTLNVYTYFWRNDDNHSFAVGENRLGPSAPNPYTFNQLGNWEVRLLMITIIHAHQFQCFYQKYFHITHLSGYTTEYQCY